MHPATLYGFITGIVALVGTIVLVGTGHVPVEAALPIISGIGLGGVGVAGGVALPRGNGTSDAGVGFADPNE